MPKLPPDDRTAALVILARLREYMEQGLALPEWGKTYLVHAIGMIQGGASADDAFGLKNRRGRPRQSKRDRQITRAVIDLMDNGATLEAASEEAAQSFVTDRNLETGEGVRKIYLRLKDDVRLEKETEKFLSAMKNQWENEVESLIERQKVEFEKQVSETIAELKENERKRTESKK